MSSEAWVHLKSLRIMVKLLKLFDTDDNQVFNCEETSHENCKKYN